MNFFLFLSELEKVAIDLGATQSLSRLNRTSSGLNLLRAQNTGKQLKPIVNTVKPVPKPLLSSTGPMPVANNPKFPMFTPQNKAGIRTISNPSPSVTVNSTPK